MRQAAWLTESGLPHTNGMFPQHSPPTEKSGKKQTKTLRFSFLRHSMKKTQHSPAEHSAPHIPPEIDV
jgi:hypothetical protein